MENFCKSKTEAARSANHLKYLNLHALAVLPYYKL